MKAIAACFVLTLSSLAGCTRPERAALDEAAVVPARTIPLPGVGAPRTDVGVPGRIDHFAYDQDTQRLFVAALENGSLEVLDLEKGERIKSIAGLAHPQGIAVVPGGRCAAVACGQDGFLRVYDTISLDEKRAIEVGRGADNVRYDDRLNAVWVAHGHTSGGAVVAFDAKTWDKLREISFRHRPESFRLDPNSPRLFANLPGGVRAEQDGAVAVVNRETGESIAETPLPGRARNFPMAFDAAHERLFIATRKPAKLIVIDTRTYTIIGEADCTDDSDDLFHDAQTNRVLVIGGGFRPDLQTPPLATATSSPAPDETGAVDVFSVGPAGELTRIAVTRTAPHARTGFFVPSRRAIYLAVPPRDGRDSEIREYLVPQ